MKNKWPLLSLWEVNITLIDCDHRTPPTTDSGYPYVTIPQIKDGRIELAQSRRISYEHYLEWTRKAKPVAYDVVLSRRCNPGETAFVAPNTDFALGQNLVLLHSDGSKVFPPFLRWLVRGPEWWEQVNLYRNPGAVFDSLKCKDIPNFKLHIPSLPEQQHITVILSSLDNKIELNRRMNQTLEQLAQTMFQQWFVAFDFPNAKGQAYRSSGGKLVESALGEIPIGWRVGNILEIASLLSGGTPKVNEPSFWDGNVKWVSAKDISASIGYFVYDTERKITGLGLAKSAAKLLPQGTTVVTARGSVGNYCILAEPMTINQSNYGLKANNPDNDWYLFIMVSNMIQMMQQHAYGTIFDTITTKTFESMRVVLPHYEVSKSYNLLVNPLFEKIKHNGIQSRTLATLRDNLLPQLLSGRLTVRQAEELVTQD